MILSDPSHWVVLTKTHWVRDLCCISDLWGGGPTLIQDLVGNKILGEQQAMLQRFQKKKKFLK